MDYAEFLEKKAILDLPTGMTELPELPDALFPFQRDIVQWALRRGRAALFAGTGLGKSLMELSWAQAVAAHTGNPVLVLAPLAVAAQLVREADKFGINARQVSEASEVGEGINVTNYQKLDHFDLAAFGGIVLDESSILKNQTGHYRTKLVDAAKAIPFRLAATATPAPNDFMELGNHAEFLGVMSYTDMLATFFVHDGGETQKWRLKGHAENEFWRWMASWSVMLRKPSDLGYSNDGYDLPPLEYHNHQVDMQDGDPETGTLFAVVAQTMQERLAARRGSVKERCQMMADIVISDLRTKYAKWLKEDGSLNIRQIDSGALTAIPNTPPNMPNNNSVGSESPKKTGRTCGNITQTTRKNINELANSRIASMPQGESDMPMTRSFASNARPLQNHGPLGQSAKPDCANNMALETSSLTPCLKSKVGDAPYAEKYTRKNQEEGCTSIIAIPAERSEDCYAEIATMDLAALQTTKRDWSVLPNTFARPAMGTWVIWCNLNAEQSALEKALGQLCMAISGANSEDEKERLHQAWIEGSTPPILIVKPSMFGHGCNWQHCADTGFVGLNDSWEQFYQAVRRFWRFGQTKPVNVHVVSASTEGATVANIKRKEADADRMAASMVLHMADLSSQEVRGSVRTRADYSPTVAVKVPEWIKEEEYA